MALHYLAKMKIMVLKDIEREEVEFVAKVFLVTKRLIQHRKVDLWLFLDTWIASDRESGSFLAGTLGVC